MLNCPKTAELIEIPFWMKTQVGWRNHVLDGVQMPQGDWAIFGGCPGHSNALAIFAAVGQPSLQHRIQSVITSCSRRDHSVCQANTSSILTISGRSRCDLSDAKWVVG